MIAGATERSRPVRMAGFQLATDFGLRPDLVTVPLPALGGAAVPSGVEVIAGRRATSGRFAPATAPVESGINSVTVAVRDALGRVTRQTVSTYAARALLRPGLTALDLGEARPGRAGPRLAGAGDLAPSRLVTGSWSLRLGPRVNLVVHGGADTRRRRSGFLSAGALWVLGSRTSAYGGALARAGGTAATAEWNHAAIDPGDWGYRAALAGGPTDRQAGAVTYQGPVGRYGVELEWAGGALAARLSARGALAIGGDGLLAADRLTGSYAVVDAGRPGVAVYRDGRPVGVTGARGKLIVPDLPAFAATRIAVDPLQLPDELAIGDVEQQVRPAARAGVTVRFDLKPARAATVQLILADGRPVPAGARVAANGAAPLPVGLDGEAWLPDVQPLNHLLVTAGASTCSATVPAPKTWRPGARLGPITCR